MKKRIILFLTALLFVVNSFAQRDTILEFSDLNYHSTFEKQSFTQFCQQKSDTLNAFLAVNDLLNEEDRIYLGKKFESLYQELISKKIKRMKTNAQIKLVYATLKRNCLQTYAQEEFLSSTLLNGRYNEATASILLAILFDRLHIAYRIIDSYDRMYMIANPGSNEVRLDLNDPMLVRLEANSEFKDDYVKFLHKIGQISDAELSTHSSTELYDKKSKEEHATSLQDLLGVSYYIRARKSLQLGEVDRSLTFVEKAYYLYPTPYIQYCYRGCLWSKLSQMTIGKTTDINYLIRQYKIGKLTSEETVSEFSVQISRLLSFTDKELLCDSVYGQLKSKITDTELNKELDYTYNLMRINQKAPDFVDIRRLDVAISIKPNIKDLNNYMETLLRICLYKIGSEQVRMDSVLHLTKQLKSATAQENLRSWYYTCLLDLAQEAFKNKRSNEGEKYLQTFEKACPPPIGNDRFRKEVEQAYRTIAISVYWSTNQNILANHNMVRRGLMYAPDSEIIKSASYDKSEVKYENTNPEVKYLKPVDGKKTPKTGRTLRVISKDKKEKVYSF